MTPKQQQIQILIDQMRKDSSMENMTAVRKGKQTDLSLINQFKLHADIPNKWFEWVNSADAQIMIIGQDWGPYSALKELMSTYEPSQEITNHNYRQEFLINAETSRTGKFIVKNVQKTYRSHFQKEMPMTEWNNIIFTMAVLFTRQGKHFRGSHNFDQKKSAELSYKYVSKQIDIIKPKIIIPLGNLAFEVVNKYFNLGYKSPKISKIVEELDGKYFIDAGDTKILPNYHPAAHVSPATQTNVWNQMWSY